MSTLVVYADTADGQILSQDGFDDFDTGFDGTYALARAGTGSTLGSDVAGVNITVGQRSFPGTYNTVVEVDEAFVSFDTSSLTSGATVSAAVLNITSNGDLSTTDFTLEARLSDWGATLTTADFIAGASLSGLTLLAHYASSGGWVAGTAYDLVDDAMAANVNKTGSTRFLLASDRTRSNTAPGGDEALTIRSADTAGTTSDPKMTVTYTVGAAGDEGISMVRRGLV